MSYYNEESVFDFEMEGSLSPAGTQDLLAKSFGNTHLQTIPETMLTHFVPATSPYAPPNEFVQSPSSDGMSPMALSPGGYQTSSLPSTTGSIHSRSSFGHGPHQANSFSNLTRLLQVHGATHPIPGHSPGPAIHQSSPMMGYDLVGQPMPHLSYPHYGLNTNHDQVMSQRLLEQDYMVNSPDVTMKNINWAIDVNAGGNIGGTAAMPIPNSRHQRKPSTSSRHTPYQKRPPSLAFSAPKHEQMASSLSPASLSLATPLTPATSPLADIATMGAGFTQEQLPAAQAILQFVNQNPGINIPATFITKDLVETSGQRGWCLIGNCGLIRARQRADPSYDANSDKEYYKRLDHLYDHIRDKHFDCRPFRCNQCTFAFGREHDLRRHLETHDPVHRECPYCAKQYTRRDNCQRHIVQKHPEFAALHSQSLPIPALGPHPGS